MNILAIDPATQCGWATRYQNKITSGTEGFHNSKTDGAGMRFLKFSKWLQQWDDVDLVVYEDVRAHMGVTAAHLYGGWIAAIQTFCEDNGIPYTGVGVGTIKAHWTGKGTAKKQAMIDEARKRGFNPKDDNEADALAILQYAIDKISF